MIRSIRACRVCGNPNLEPVLDLGHQFLTGVFPAPGDPDPTCGPLDLVRCAGDAGLVCGLLQLGHAYDLSEMYGPGYGYRSAISASMVRHLRAKAEALLAFTGAGAGDAVLDIGCNDGTLLAACAGRGLHLVGIDPSSAKFAAEFPDGAELIVDFFSAEKVTARAAGRRFRAVTSVAMFYDLEDPVAFMAEVRALLSPDGVWEFEQSYMPFMLDRLAYDTVCHEHISYYGLAQIDWMARRAGLKLLDVGFNAVNGGSFWVRAARDDAPLVPDRIKLDAIVADERRRGLFAAAPFERFRGRVFAHRDKTRRWFDRARRSRLTVFGYGASTKGNVLIQFCGLGPRDLPAIGEIYPAKFGRETPGSRIPILPESELRALSPDVFFVLPWHFRDDIVKRETAFLADGGAFLFPLPTFDSVGGVGIAGSFQHATGLAG